MSCRRVPVFVSLSLISLLGLTPAFAQTESPAPGQTIQTISGHADSSIAEPPNPESTQGIPSTEGTPGTLGTGSTVPALKMPSWKSLFTDTVGDFKRLPSKETAMWLGIGALGAFATHPADKSLTSELVGNSSLREPAEPGAIIGGTQYEIAASLATFAIGRAKNSPTIATLGADLFRAQAVAELSSDALKFAFNRTRPDGTNYSFPSGHTATSFASATVLQQHFGWKVGIPAYAIASYVAASRIQMNRHYLSDVAFGAALGIASGRTVMIGRGKARFAVGPMAAPGGGGVSFTLAGQK
jgi:membrane-associated phospholipid phosphatase